MAVWSDADLTRWSEQVEDRFAAEFNCIEKRIAIALVSGTPTYLLGTDVLSIRRITYNGIKIDPLPRRQKTAIFQNYVTVGNPKWYLYNDLMEQKQITIFPTPQTTVTASGNLYGVGIRTGMVMSYWSRPDFSTYIIPTWFRMRVIKAGVMALAYQQEGVRQNLKAAQYWDNKFVRLANRCGAQMQTLMATSRRLTLKGNVRTYGNWPAPPVLPIDQFGPQG